MLRITKKQLFIFLSGEHDRLNPTLVAALKKCDITGVVCSISMGDDHLGGDTVIDVVGEALEAVAAGYQVVTWYGPETEALVAGIRPTEIAIGERRPRSRHTRNLAAWDRRILGLPVEGPDHTVTK